MKALIKRLATAYNTGCAKLVTGFERYLVAILLVVGTILLFGGLTEVALAQGNSSETFATPEFNDNLIRGAVGNLFALIEGAFGALIMVVAGIGAIVAAAMGAYRAAVGMLVVAVGAFILRALVSLFFGQEFEAIGVDATAT